jgi:hypothetical protein
MRKEINTAFDSRGIAPESLHETMFREHFSGERKLEFEFQGHEDGFYHNCVEYVMHAHFSLSFQG